MAPDATRRFPTDALFAVGFGGENDLTRHDAVVEDLLLVVKVIDEQVQRVNALLETLFQPAPLDRRDNARHNVEREDLLHARLLAVHIEGDPHLHQRALGGRLSPHKLPLRKRLNAVHQVARARAGRLGVRQELVIEAPYLIAGKIHEYKRNNSSASVTNCRGRKAFSRLDASVGDNSFQPQAWFPKSVNSHSFGSEHAIALRASGIVQQCRVPRLAQLGQKGAANPATVTPAPRCYLRDLFV